MGEKEVAAEHRHVRAEDAVHRLLLPPLVRVVQDVVLRCRIYEHVDDMVEDFTTKLRTIYYTCNIYYIILMLLCVPCLFAASLNQLIISLTCHEIYVSTHLSPSKYIM